MKEILGKNSFTGFLVSSFVFTYLFIRYKLCSYLVTLCFRSGDGEEDGEELLDEDGLPLLEDQHLSGEHAISEGKNAADKKKPKVLILFSNLLKSNSAQTLT